MEIEKTRREAFALRRKHVELIEELGQEKGWQFLIGIAQYALDDKEPEFKGILKVIWPDIKKEIDTSNRRYEICVENGKKGARYGILGAVHGRKGGRPRKTPIKPQ